MKVQNRAYASQINTLFVSLQSADGVARARIEAEMRHAATTRAMLVAARSQRAAGGVSEGVPPEQEPEPEPEGR